MQVTASAPGKVVLSGEYAVLAGAPALVMATNRRAHCTLATTQEPTWQFQSRGFNAQSTHPLSAVLAPEQIGSDDPARLCGWVLRQAAQSASVQWPAGMQVSTDSSQMYHAGSKLGLGSSAALTTALAGAIWQLAQRNAPQFADLHAAHQASQGGIGSGLDVATSLLGGVIRFEAGNSEPAQWPAHLVYRFVYAGKPASTPELVSRFNAWRSRQSQSKAGNATNSPERLKNDELTVLINASATLANRGISLDNFARYINALRALDEAATIGIFSAGHADIAIAAERTNVLYKPCGAGGGDLGVALSDNQQDLDRFTARIGNAYAVIDLEIASNGLTIG